MGSISCCEKRIYPFLTEIPRENIRNGTLSINIMRNTKPKQITSGLAISRDTSNMEQTPRSNNLVKSPQKKSLDEMNDKLKKIKQKKKNSLKEIERLSGKKLLNEVFS